MGPARHIVRQCVTIDREVGRRATPYFYCRNSNFGLIHLSKAAAPSVQKGIGECHKEVSLRVLEGKMSAIK